MNDLLERLRARGWRITTQRRVVAESLRGYNVHLTADEIHTRAQQQLPEISRATVYNTLNELVAMGELAEVVPRGRSNRYDPNVVHRHHHLYCTECEALEDVQATNIDKLQIVPNPEGFQVDDVDVVFSGVCTSCAVDSHPS